VVTFKPGKEMEELVRTMDLSKLPLLTSDDDADDETDGPVEPVVQPPGQTHATAADSVE
jgi:integration host factor subunit beta